MYFILFFDAILIKFVIYLIIKKNVHFYLHIVDNTIVLKILISNYIK